MMGGIFPYEPRKGQMEIVERLTREISERRHSIVQSGTGTGKTICALSAALANCGQAGRKVLYLTRTNSQQRQVILELRAIAERCQFFGIALQGRRNMCPHVDISEELRTGTHDELSLLCGQKKARVLNGDPNACKYYHGLTSTDCSGIESWARRTLPTAEEFAGYCEDRGICPYELSKVLARDARVVTAPYIYFFNPFIRGSLLEWMDCTVEDLVVIVDEAHNLPDYARELRTASLSMRMIDLAEREVEELRDPEISEGTSALDVLRMIQEVLREAVKEFVLEDDGLVPSGLLEEELMARLRLTSVRLAGLAAEMTKLGEITRDRRKREGRLPRSYLHAVGGFLEFWMSVREEAYVKLVLGGDNPMFEAYCMDPSLACSVLQDAFSSVHMSGTLEPLDEYRDSIGLVDKTCTLIFPSPFPADNLLIMHADDVTSKFEDIARDESLISRMRAYISAIVEGSGRNAAVFFSSYNLMERLIKDGLLGDIRRPIFIEERGMPQEGLMSIVTGFKNCDTGAVMFAVSGGRISEGIDFPDRELEVAIIAGIPYPKPTARLRALQHYYELKFGRGWEYVVKAPATRKVLQSIGRLIRSESDRGIAFVLDRRIVQFRPLIESIQTRDPEEEVERFFSCEVSSNRLRLSRRKLPRISTAPSQAHGPRSN